MDDAFFRGRELIDAGDVDGLRALLAAHPQLAATRGPAPNRTLLHHAASDDRVEMVQALLAAGAPVDGGRPDDSTPLHFAAGFGLTAVCEALVEAGAPVGTSDGSGEGGTPLVQALFYGHTETAHMLARHAVVPDNLRVAAGLGDADGVESFFDADGALTDAAARSRTWYRPHDEFPPWTPSDDPQEIVDEALVWASLNGHVEVAARLIERGADVSGKPYFATALHVCQWHGHMEVARLLLACGADLSVHDDLYAGTPVDWSFYFYARDEMQRLILEAAAPDDPIAAHALGRYDLLESQLRAGNAPDALFARAVVDDQLRELLADLGPEPPLTFAILLDRLDVVDRWLAGGGDPDTPLPVEHVVSGEGTVLVDMSLLLYAAINRKPEVCARLRAAGATVDVFSAAALDDVDALEAAGAAERVTAHDAFGRTALHRAIQGHATGAVRWLLEHGADVHTPADTFSEGARALHVAAEADAPPAIFSLLRDHGADLDEERNPGTPLDCALRVGAEEAEAWLRAKGARATAASD